MMSGKRWIAIAIAVGIFFISTIFNFFSYALSSNFKEVFEVAENEWLEHVVERGNGRGKIVVLDVNGIIQDTGDAVPLFSTGTYHHRQFLSMLEQAGEDPSIDGILLRVDTPGGGVVESAEIHDRITKIKEETEKPIFVSMGSMAASGGYYIAAPADKIIAHPSTITGSLGVILESVNFAGLAEQLGIEANVIKSGEFKDIMSPLREMTEAEQQILQEMLDESYNEFVRVIAEGRNMDESEVRKIADGRIYSGNQSVELDLVDELGSKDEAVQLLMEHIGKGNIDVVRYEPSFGLNQFFALSAQKVFQTDHDLLGIKELLNQSNSPTLKYLYRN